MSETTVEGDRIPLLPAQHVLWYLGDHAYGLEPGGFVRRLLACFAVADRTNTALLSRVYPDYGQAWELAMHTSGGFEKLRDQAVLASRAGVFR